MYSDSEIKKDKRNKFNQRLKISVFFTFTYSHRKCENFIFNFNFNIELSKTQSKTAVGLQGQVTSAIIIPLIK